MKISPIFDNFNIYKLEYNCNKFNKFPDDDFSIF